MKRLIELMDQKNHYLEKFYTINETHLEYFLKNRFEMINEFYDSRENILEILNYIDQEIKIVSHAAAEESLLDVQKLKECLSLKDTFVKRIIEQDVDILACIEAAKNSIIAELKEVRTGKKVISAYKTPVFNESFNEEEL
ncbi:MAG: hypothetical protein JNL11_17870 [Bdellovibrionaceae bacterium]|nr:hypothetical protein [Pseudobdellovibrionaceae bacterium]